VRISRETLATGFDTFTRAIDNPQVLAVIFEIMRPSPESGRNFQNRAGWQEIANARKDCAGPLCSGTAPRRGSFLARLFPIVFHLVVVRTIPTEYHEDMAADAVEKSLFPACLG